jgi:hypothetical protein
MAKKPADSEDVLNVIADLSAMIAARFDAQDARFDRIEIEIFKRGRDLDDVKADLSVVKDKVNHIYSGLDSQAKHIDDIRIDNKVRDHQYERMERWVLQLADKINVKLKYE